MDPGTALSVASLVYDVSKDLYEYYRAWKDCDKDVEELRVQLLWLHNAFRVTREIVRKLDLSAEAVNLVYTALAGCNDAANELRDILNKVRKEGASQGVLAKLKAHGRRACYPFRKSTVTAIVEQVESCRDGLHLAVNLLGLDITENTLRMLQDVDRRLVDGFEGIDNALKQLPAMASDLSSINSQIKALKTDTEHMKETLRDTKERDAMRAILDWFCDADYSQQQNDLLARRQNGTGKWFLESPTFKAWFQSAEKTLICPGQPGAGKTIMAATVINQLFETADPTSVAIIYLFCNYKRKSEQSTTHLLGALLRQLVYSKASVPQPVMDIYTNHKIRNSRPSEDELRKALTTLVQLFTGVYIVIDALDECERGPRMQVLSVVRELQIGGRVYLLTTTRPIPDILEQFPAALSLEVRAHEDDVALYLRTRIAELPRCVRENPTLQDKIVANISAAVDGMFLLAQLHMDSLKDKRTVKSASLALEKLPLGSDTGVYDQVYSEAMERIRGQPKGDRDLAEEALSWVTLARRRLTTIEFRHALAVEIDGTAAALDEDNLLPIDEIVSLCAGLIAEDNQSGVVRLVHYTTQKFLETAWPQWIPDAETRIAQKCVRYLSFDKFMEGPCQSDEELNERIAENPLLEYSALCWGVHLLASEQQAETQSHALLHNSALCFLRNADLVLTATQAMSISDFQFERHAAYYAKKTDGSHLAARFGTVRLLEALSNAGFETDFPDSYGHTPLSLAATNGHSAVVKLLLETGQVDVHSKDSFGETPLWLAARGGHEAVVRLLLETGQVDVNSKDENGETPLSQAAECGHQAVARLLLERGQVDVNSQNNINGRTPLWGAASNGHETVVRLLLETGRVDVDLHDNSGRTPLWGAAYNGHEAVVRLLLERGQVDIDSQDYGGRTPLWGAASIGHEAVVRLLLERGPVDVNSKDKVNGRTPLWRAASKGCDIVVRLLLETGYVDVDSKNGNGETPLSIAATNGHETVVRLLLETGQVDIDSKDDSGGTPLSRARELGDDTIAKLMETAQMGEVDIDQNGRTAMSLADTTVEQKRGTIMALHRA